MSEEQNTNQQDEYSGGLMEMSTGTQVGIAVGFAGLPLLAGAAEVLHLGFAGLVMGAVGASAVGLVGKHVIDQQKASGRDIHVPVLDQLRNADWGALLRPVEEQGNTIEEQREISSPAPALESEPEIPAAPLEEESFDEYMHFGETLRPSADKILSGRKVLFGVSEAGKSNAIATIVEEIGGRYGAPLFLLDTEDEYRAICDKQYLARPLWVDKSKIKPEQAFEFAQWAVHNLRQVVINLQNYEDHEAAWLMINLIKGVQAYEETHEARVPCEIILDEATVWLPQLASQSSLSKILVDDPDGMIDQGEDDEGKGKQATLLSLLERAFFSIVVRRGRKRGIGLTLAAQRIAEINKSALQASWTFLLKQTQPADFKVYKQYGIESNDILQMLPGEAFVFAPGKPMERHRFRLRKSPHGAKTPGLKELRAHQERLAVARREQSAPPIPVEIPTPTREPHRSAPIFTKPRRLYTIPRTKPFIETIKPREPEPEPLTEREQLYEKAMKAWENGARSIRTMQEALDLKFNQARDLLEEMDELGLIHWKNSNAV